MIQISLARHCDADGCDTWQRTGGGLRPDTWLIVEWSNRKLHFCSWDCALRYGAAKEPVTEVQL